MESKVEAKTMRKRCLKFAESRRHRNPHAPPTHTLQRPSHWSSVLSFVSGLLWVGGGGGRMQSVRLWSRITRVAHAWRALPGRDFYMWKGNKRATLLLCSGSFWSSANPVFFLQEDTCTLRLRGLAGFNWRPSRVKAGQY